MSGPEEEFDPDDFPDELDESTHRALRRRAEQLRWRISVDFGLPAGSIFVTNDELLEAEYEAWRDGKDW